MRKLRQFEYSWDAKCGMLAVETWAAVSEEGEGRRGYVLDFWTLIAVVRQGCGLFEGRKLI